MTTFQHGDRVRRGDNPGTVDKSIPAQGSFQEVCVVDWDDGSRTTECLPDLVREEVSSE